MLNYWPKWPSLLILISMTLYAITVPAGMFKATSESYCTSPLPFINTIWNTIDKRKTFMKWSCVLMCLSQSKHTFLTNLRILSKSRVTAALLPSGKRDGTLTGSKDSLFKEGKDPVHFQWLLNQRMSEIHLPMRSIKTMRSITSHSIVANPYKHIFNLISIYSSFVVIVYSYSPGPWLHRLFCQASQKWSLQKC